MKADKDFTPLRRSLATMQGRREGARLTREFHAPPPTAAASPRPAGNLINRLTGGNPASHPIVQKLIPNAGATNPLIQKLLKRP